MRLLFLVALLPLLAFSQIGASEPVAEVVSTTNATSYAFGAFTPSANAILVVMVFATDTVAAGSMSGGSLTWTRKASYTWGAHTAYLFWARTGGSPASTTITFDCTGDAASGVSMSVVQFTGGDVVTADPIRQFRYGTATAANPSVTFASNMSTSNGYCAAFGINRTTVTSAPPGSWTETHDTGYSTPNAGGSGAFRAGGETGATVTFTAASGTWAMYAVEVYVSGSGPTVGSQGANRRRRA